MRVAIQALAAILKALAKPNSNWTAPRSPEGRADRAPDPAGARARIRCGGHRGSARRGLPGRAPHARDRGCRGRLSGQDRRSGGAVPAIPFMQREIQDAAYRYQQEIETHARVVVGVNEFVTEAPPPAALFQSDPARRPRQADRLPTSGDGGTGSGGTGPRRPGGGARDRQSRAPAARRRASRRHPGEIGTRLRARSSAFTAHRWHSDPVRRTRLALGSRPWSAPRLPRWPCLVPPAPRGRTCCRTWARPTRRWPRSW